MEFCKAFNEKDQVPGRNSNSSVNNDFLDRTFTFVTKTPPATFLIKRAAKLAKGSSNPKKEMAGSITKSQVKEIAQLKMVDLNAKDIEGAMKIIEGSVRSMGLEVVEG